MIICSRILEFLSREDADRAVKELDGKDLRGRAVRVDLDESVCFFLADLVLAHTSVRPIALWT